MHLTNLRITLFLLLAPLQFVTSRLHELTGLGRSVGDMANDAPTFATPAPYAFLIWLLIFTLWTICAGIQARPSQRKSVLWQRIGWPIVTVLAASNLWMLIAILKGNGPMLLALILLMLAATFTALGRAASSLATDVLPSPIYRRVVVPALAIMAGWLTLASFLNLAGVLQLTLGLPTGSMLGAVVTLLAAVVMGATAIKALDISPVAQVSYGLTLIWGLLAVAVANAQAAQSAIGVASLPVAVTALLGAAAVLGLLGMAAKKGR